MWPKACVKCGHICDSVTDMHQHLRESHARNLVILCHGVTSEQTGQIIESKVPGKMVRDTKSMPSRNMTGNEDCKVVIPQANSVPVHTNSPQPIFAQDGISEANTTMVIPGNDKSMAVSNNRKTTDVPNNKTIAVSNKDKVMAVPGNNRTIIRKFIIKKVVRDNDKAIIVPDNKTIIPSNNKTMVVLNNNKAIVVPSSNKGMVVPDNETMVVSDLLTPANTLNQPAHMFLGPDQKNSSPKNQSLEGTASDFPGTSGIECNICDAKYESVLEYTSHLKVHSTDSCRNSTICGVCDESFSSIVELEMHISELHTLHPKSQGQRISIDPALQYWCHLCGQTFRLQSDLANHLGIHKQCVICEQRFSTYSDLKMHNKVKHQGNSYLLCKQSGTKFTRVTYLPSHQNTAVKSFHCDKCGINFAHRAHLERHQKFHLKAQQNNNLELELWTCDCGATYSNRISLKRHQTSPLGLKSWPCKLCPKSFALKCSLEAHQKSHPAVKQEKKTCRVKCGVCDELYMSLEELKLHIKKHKKDNKDYNCRDCGLSLDKESSLKEHRKIHLAVKPWACFCGATLSSTKNLKLHQNKVHNGNQR